MSIKKRYNYLIYTFLSLALICIIAGIVSSNSSNITNAIKTEEKKVTTDKDPLEKTNKKLIIKSYIEQISKEERKSDLINKEMLTTWYSYDISKIEYKRTKEIANDTNIYSYLVELRINNQGATLPINNGTKEGTEYITTNLVFNIYFDSEAESYVVYSVEKP